jgi:hypothetical protein
MQLFDIGYLRFLSSQLDVLTGEIESAKTEKEVIKLVEKGMFIADMIDEISDKNQDLILFKHDTDGTLGDYSFYKMLYKIQYDVLTFVDDKENTYEKMYNTLKK